MSYTYPSLISKGSGAAQTKYFQIRLVLLDDIASYPTEIEGSVELSGNYALKTGKYFLDLQVTASKTDLPGAGEGDEDNVSYAANPSWYHPGSTVEIENFIQNTMNKSVLAFQRIGACGSPNSYWLQFGSCGAPLSLLPEHINNNDETGWLLKFQQFAKTDKLPKRYTGTFTLATVNTVAADSTTVDVSNGSGEYQLQDNASTTVITDITNAAAGGVYTLIGSGGSNPATIEATNTNFLLAGAVDWSGLSGATLTVEAFAIDGGDFVFVEKSRS